MDAGANYMYQRNPNDRPTIPPRPTPNGGNNSDGNGGPPRTSGSTTHSAYPDYSRPLIVGVVPDPGSLRRVQAVATPMPLKYHTAHFTSR